MSSVGLPSDALESVLEALARSLPAGEVAQTDVLVASESAEDLAAWLGLSRMERSSSSCTALIMERVDPTTSWIACTLQHGCLAVDGCVHLPHQAVEDRDRVVAGGAVQSIGESPIRSLSGHHHGTRSRKSFDLAVSLSTPAPSAAGTQRSPQARTVGLADRLMRKRLQRSGSAVSARCSRRRRTAPGR